MTQDRGEASTTMLPRGSNPRVPHAIKRWIGVVLPVIDSPTDLRTITEWASWVGISAGALRTWCRMAGLPAKRSLSLARMLRVVMHLGEGERAENLLDIVDTRTLRKFLRLGHPEGSRCRVPLRCDELLDRQRWITDPLALRELSAALRARDAGLKERSPGE